MGLKILIAGWVFVGFMTSPSFAANCWESNGKIDPKKILSQIANPERLQQEYFYPHTEGELWLSDTSKKALVILDPIIYEVNRNFGLDSNGKPRPPEKIEKEILRRKLNSHPEDIIDLQLEYAEKAIISPEEPTALDLIPGTELEVIRRWGGRSVAFIKLAQQLNGKQKVEIFDMFVEIIHRRTDGYWRALKLYNSKEKYMVYVGKLGPDGKRPSVTIRLNGSVEAGFFELDINQLPEGWQKVKGGSYLPPK